MPVKNYSANFKIGAIMSSTVGRVFGNIKGKIKEQESTLKKLRAAYKDASKGTGEYAAKLEELRREISKTERGLTKLRSVAKFDIGKSLRGIGSTFGKDLGRAGVAGGIVGAAGLGIAKNMLDVTAAFEKSLTILKTVEGSQEKANQAFSWVQDFAQKTPFELQQVTDAFVRLRAYGIDPIRGESLRILGDTASAMGKDVMDAVEAIADATTGENERLKEFGIKAKKEGGKIFYTWTDKKGKQLRASADENNQAIIKSTLLAIWNSKYKGAMDEQSRTWNGMISNMKDSWARFAYMTMQSGPFEILKIQLGDLLKKIEGWSKDGTLKKWANDTGKWMIDTGKEISKIAKEIWGAIDATQEFLGGWKNLGIAIVALNFAPTIVAVGQLAGGLISLTRVLYSLAPAWVAGLGPVAWVGAAITGIGLVIYSLVDPGGPMDILGRMFPETMETVRTAVEKAVNWISDKFDMLGEKIRGFIESIGKLTGLGGFFDKPAGVGRDIPSYMTARPMGTVQSLAGGGLPTQSLGVKPQAQASQADLQNFISAAGARTNNFNINVNAPGADGQAIGQGIRREIQRKPLYDLQGAK